MTFSRLPVAVAAGLSMWSASVSAQQPQATTVAFVNVNVIPLDIERIEQRRTVVVRAGRIAAVGGDEVTVPTDAVVIDGSEQYLVPGLTDAHVHLPGSVFAKTRDDFGDA